MVELSLQTGKQSFIAKQSVKKMFSRQEKKLEHCLDGRKAVSSLHTNTGMLTNTNYTRTRA